MLHMLLISVMVLHYTFIYIFIYTITAIKRQTVNTLFVKLFHNGRKKGGG